MLSTYSETAIAGRPHKKPPDPTVANEPQREDGGESEETMAETTKLAVPTMGEGGLDSERSGHFGHCDCFTLIDIVDGELGEVSIIQNPPHEEGGCLRPVGLLSDAGATAIVAAGMGMRPMMGFANAGIDVLFDNVTPGVGDVAKLAAAGTLPHMTANEACHH